MLLRRERGPKHVGAKGGRNRQLEKLRSAIFFCWGKAAVKKVAPINLPLPPHQIDYAVPFNASGAQEEACLGMDALCLFR